ncbi:head-tail adaptor protein [Methylobacterium sp. D54C]
MDPGRLDRRVTFRRRTALDDDPTGRGDYADLFTTWANYRPAALREAVQGGGAVNVASGTLAIRDSARARDLVTTDRVTLQGQDFDVKGVGLPDRRTGLILMQIETSLGGQ